MKKNIIVITGGAGFRVKFNWVFNKKTNFRLFSLDNYSLVQKKSY